MKHLPRLHVNALPALLLGLAAPVLAELAPTEWQNRQAMEVAGPGLVRVELPAATFDAAQRDLADLRVLGPAGDEVAILVERAPETTAVRRSPLESAPVQNFAVRSTPDGTQVSFQLAEARPLLAVDLETSNPFFLKAAHAETSMDGEAWSSVGPAELIFRQLGVEQLQLSLGREFARFVRVTVDDLADPAVSFHGARVFLAPARPEPVAPRTVPIDGVITRREEFAGETVLTVALAGRRVPLAALRFEIPDPLFTRQVTIAVREPQIPGHAERTIAHGTIYRVALQGRPARAQLEVPLDFSPEEKEILVHIHNGDSPPLRIDQIVPRIHPIQLVFHAAKPGVYELLTGNPQATAPQYDLTGLSTELRRAPGSNVIVGPLSSFPSYHPPEIAALPEVPVTGSPLDTRAWRQHRALRVAATGVQELELDPAALAGARPDHADVRILQGGNQVPYLLERPALSRALALSAVPDPDPKRPTVSRWRVTLPYEGLPLERVALATSTALFARQFRFYETVSTPEGRSAELTLAAGEWRRTPAPGASAAHTFELTQRPRTDTLWIETDNGDNPPISLDAVTATYPVVRLIFKASSTEGFALAYGHATVDGPRYDLSLVARRLLTAPRQVAGLDPAPPPAAKSFLDHLDRRFAFWAALALVVIILLVVMARLLPKATP